MNKHTRTRPAAAQTGWPLPEQEPDISDGRPGRSTEDLAQWRRLTLKVAEIATREGWSKSDVARRIGMPDGTFSQWFSGKYEGRLDGQNQKAGIWVASVAEMSSVSAVAPESPPFIHTRLGREIITTLAFAQAVSDLVTVTAAAGTGKTMACNHFAATRANVHMVTASSYMKTPHALLVELADELELTQHNPARLVRAIGKRLARSGNALLIIDEAQCLSSDAINQARHFSDKFNCGVALVGNDEIHARFSPTRDGPSNAQMRRRVGKRVTLAKPHIEDISALLDAWSVNDPESRKFLTGIGLKDGALGQIDKTLKLAHMRADGDGAHLTAAHVRAAWSNRNVEGL